MFYLISFKISIFLLLSLKFRIHWPISHRFNRKYATSIFFGWLQKKNTNLCCFYLRQMFLKKWVQSKKIQQKNQLMYHTPYVALTSRKKTLFSEQRCYCLQWFFIIIRCIIKKKYKYFNVKIMTCHYISVSQFSPFFP